MNDLFRNGSIRSITSPAGDGRSSLGTDRQRVATDAETAMPARSGCGLLGDGARVFDNGPLALVAHNHVVILILTGPSVMVGAGALISDAFFLIQSRATVTL